MSESVWVGLCGRSGAGKGYISSLFAQWGIPSVDTDRVYREMTGPTDTLSACMKELVCAFGEEILCPDGSLNRRALADTVFAEGGDSARRELNRITHAHILRQTRQIADVYSKAGAPFVLIDAPLLFESGFDVFCRYTVCVTAPDDVCVSRIKARDGLTETEARRRLAAQISGEELVRLCDFAIVNDGIRPVKEQAEQIYKAIVETGGIK